MARIPLSAPLDVRKAFQELHDRLDRLGASTAANVDLRGKRFLNVGDAQAPGDLATHGQLVTEVDDAVATLRKELLKAIEDATGNTPATPGDGGGGGGGGGGGDTHDDFSSYVQQAKDELVAASADITGPCGAFAIVSRAAQLIASVDATIGLLEKSGGNNCSGYATDILCFTDGAFYDVLIGGGDPPPDGNTPTWAFSGVDASRYRPPI